MRWATTLSNASDLEKGPRWGESAILNDGSPHPRCPRPQDALKAPNTASQPTNNPTNPWPCYANCMRGPKTPKAPRCLRP
eukprot:2428980-Pyramimonas_sp.AAC.1